MNYKTHRNRHTDFSIYEENKLDARSFTDSFDKIDFGYFKPLNFSFEVEDVENK